MRRLLASILVAAVLAAAVLLVAVGGTALPAVAAPAPVAGTAQADGGGSPSIIPDPDEEGTSNMVGLAVVTVLFGAWIAGGAFLLVRARRRRDGGPAAVDRS